jgi:hypothetical protein
MLNIKDRLQQKLKNKMLSKFHNNSETNDDCSPKNISLSKDKDNYNKIDKIINTHKQEQDLLYNDYINAKNEHQRLVKISYDLESKFYVKDKEYLNAINDFQIKKNEFDTILNNYSNNLDIQKRWKDNSNRILTNMKNNINNIYHKLNIIINKIEEIAGLLQNSLNNVKSKKIICENFKLKLNININ